MQYILSTADVSLSFLVRLFRLTQTIMGYRQTRDGRRQLLEVAKGFTLGRIFWPQSSRTFHQFGVAGLSIGMGVGEERGIRQEHRDGSVTWILPFSSEVKDEEFEDSIRAWASAYDVLVLRHSEDDAIARAVRILKSFNKVTRVINAGAGRGEHPTQAFIDLFAILTYLGYDIERDWRKLNEMPIMFVGDNTARTAHSLARLLGPLGVPMWFVSPPELALPEAYQVEFKKKNFRFECTDKLQENMLAYVLRINASDYSADKALKERLEVLVPQYAITQETLREKHIRGVFHPLPRRKEIPIWLPDKPETHPISIDRMPEAQYFNQMDYGVPLRMALLWLMTTSETELSDIQRDNWASSFIAQCANCGKIKSTIFGWVAAQPPCRFLAKISCPECFPKILGKRSSWPQ